MRAVATSLLITALSACGGGGGGSSADANAIPADPSDQPLVSQTFRADGLPEREYHVFVPASLEQGAPLMVFLHGCNQTGPDVAVGTRWNQLAAREGIVVVYPDQKDPNDDEVGEQDFVNDGNGARCWNWFRPEHQARGEGEPATIAGITLEVAQQYGTDPTRTYVMGLSAGGIMASVMAATYPDIYAAHSIVAGCGYPACSDTTGALAVAAMGAQARRMPVIIFHGTADQVQAYPHGQDAVRQWLGSNDMIDDGQANQSVPATANATETFGFEDTNANSVDGSEDLCIRNANVPCAAPLLGYEESYPVTIDQYVDANGCPLLEFWTVHGLGHSYPGGDVRGTFTDPTGPDITSAAFNFLIAQDKGGTNEQGLCE